MPFPPVPMPTPPAHADPSAKWEEHTAPSGDKYYYNPVTKESKWEKPAGAIVEKDEPVEWELLGSTPWQRVQLKSGKKYFSNTETKERCWDPPTDEVKEICANL